MQQYSSVKVQLINKIHALARRNFPRRHVVIKGIGDTFQVDLVEMSEYFHDKMGEMNLFFAA